MGAEKLCATVKQALVCASIRKKVRKIWVVALPMAPSHYKHETAAFVVVAGSNGSEYIKLRKSS